jgi:hypothetical protein
LRAWVRPPGYIANAHVLYNIYVYMHRCKVGACKWVRVCVLAHACDRVRALTPTSGSPMWAPHTCAHVLRPCARACVRVRLGGHASGPTHASAFRRHGPREVRLAGVPVGLGVQREHRRVEHRLSVEHAVCMGRLFGPGGAPPRRDALGGSSMRRGPLCAAAPPMRSGACVRRRVGTRMRGCPRVKV